VDITCWQQDPEINAWMRANGYPAGDWSWIVAHYYTQMIASLAKAGFKPIMFAEAFGALNSTGVDLTHSGIIFDGWDQGTPGSLAAAIMAPGVKAIVSSYCFLAPTQSCPDNLPGGDTPNWFTNINCEIQNATLFPAAAVPFLGNIVGGHPSRWGEQTDGSNIIQVRARAGEGGGGQVCAPAPPRRRRRRRHTAPCLAFSPLRARSSPGPPSSVRPKSCGARSTPPTAATSARARKSSPTTAASKSGAACPSSLPARTRGRATTSGSRRTRR
jgi:hypothetical protein